MISFIQKLELYGSLESTRRVIARFKCKYQVLWRSLMKLTLRGHFCFDLFSSVGLSIEHFLHDDFQKGLIRKLWKIMSLSWWEDFEHELSKIKKTSKCGDENIILKQKVPSLLKSDWSWECLLLLSYLLSHQDRGKWNFLALICFHHPQHRAVKFSICARIVIILS